ncbi:hypothetical protein SAMN05216516_109114 [Izhakiella capsodis]|uniref:Uncharacterized protein n=1 Tax=Izhakiella capsodis TaxID=1367852 RepID=A0A1I4ZS20_9GAMM|nr:hypothetical protein [Izhakiella capsodis]SFN52853.1 hypothetical protein SAMN05216516_109114 [Izhakiella capsodis]
MIINGLDSKASQILNKHALLSSLAKGKKSGGISTKIANVNNQPLVNRWGTLYRGMENRPPVTRSNLGKQIHSVAQEKKLYNPLNHLGIPFQQFMHDVSAEPFYGLEKVHSAAR